MPCLTVTSTDQTRLWNTKFGTFAENINFISLLDMCLTVLLEEKATENWNTGKRNHCLRNSLKCTKESNIGKKSTSGLKLDNANWNKHQDFFKGNVKSEIHLQKLKINIEKEEQSWSILFLIWKLTTKLH